MLMLLELVKQWDMGTVHIRKFCLRMRRDIQRTLQIRQQHVQPWKRTS